MRSKVGALSWTTGVLAIVGLLLALHAGCGRDSEVKTVDFSRTITSHQPSSINPADKPVRVAVGAMVSPKETFVHYKEILDYIGRKLERRVDLIQRKTYREINQGLEKGEIDLAFLCSGPYVTGRDNSGFQLIAAPQINGSNFYRSYLIVNEASPVSKLEDLQGKTFAFTDPDSNTGKLVPTRWLAEIEQKPETFFSKTILTYSHDNSILAVAKGLVDAASVDSLIWDYYSRRNPELTARTRIIKKSEPYGIPPLVASPALSHQLKHEIGRIVISLHNDAEGRRILDNLMIDRFVEAKDEWYDSIRKMINLRGSLETVDYDSAKH